MLDIVVGIVGLLLIGYLFVSVIRPEKFQERGLPMDLYGRLQPALFLGLLLLVTRPMGVYLYRSRIQCGGQLRNEHRR